MRVCVSCCVVSCVRAHVRVCAGACERGCTVCGWVSDDAVLLLLLRLLVSQMHILVNVCAHNPHDLRTHAHLHAVGAWVVLVLVWWWWWWRWW